MLAALRRSAIDLAEPSTSSAGEMPLSQRAGHGAAAAHRRLRRGFIVAGVLLGLGLGGFIDGIVLHQILQWHHMLTDYGSHASFPKTTVASLEDNTVWDGLFHLSTWVFVTVGVFALWRVLVAGYRVTWRSLVGLLLVGWGTFNVVEGVVDHHILTIHHVRDDVASPLWWDVAFLVLGALLILVGIALQPADRHDPAASSLGGDTWHTPH